MKTIIIIIILLLTVFSVFPDIELHGYLETAYITRGGIYYINKYILLKKDCFFTDFKIYIIVFKNINIGGNIKSYQKINIKNFYFEPFYVGFNIYIEYKIKNMQIGFSHSCHHIVKINNENIFLIENGEEKLYLKLTF